MRRDQSSEVHRETEQTYLVALSVYVHGALSSELTERVRALIKDAMWQFDSSDHALRLWQPPLPCCEWRTIGVLHRNRRELRELLELVRQHGWQTDDVTHAAAGSDLRQLPTILHLLSTTRTVQSVTLIPRQYPEGRASRRAACSPHQGTLHVGRCSYSPLSAVGAQGLAQ
jgi:muconolactone delta-isomerase